MKQITGSYRLTGRRTTNQRKLLLDLIQQTAGHLDADELYRKARDKGATLSLSTVYRNLKIFKDLNLIHERHFAEEHHHYETKADHHHVVCLGCGKVVEFKSPVTGPIKRQLIEQKGFVVADAEVRIMGYCSQCWQDMTAEERDAVKSD